MFWKSNKNRGILYIQPDASYNVLVPLKILDGIYTAPWKWYWNFLSRASTVQTLITRFYIMKSGLTLSAMTYYNRSGKEVYNQHFTKFKEAVEEYYASDTSEYLKAYVQYSIYEMEELNPAAKLHRYSGLWRIYQGQAQGTIWQTIKYMKYLNRFYSNVLASWTWKITTGFI